MILICSATENELKPLKLKFVNNKKFKFFITGVGILRTTFNIMSFLSQNKNKIELIIFSGIGGGFKENGVKLNDICIANEEILGDFGVCFNKYIDYFEFSHKRINLKNDFFKAILEKYCNIVAGSFITVNCVSANSNIIDFYKKKYNPICENMEGFAAAYICKKLNIDFLEIRCISNYVGDRENWNVKESIKNLNSFLMEVLENNEII